jgi:hypothetical protein
MNDIPDDLLDGMSGEIPNPSGYTTIKDFMPDETKHRDVYERVQDTLAQLHADPAMQAMNSSPFIAAVFAYACGWLASRSANQALAKLDADMPELLPHNRERLHRPILEAAQDAFMQATRVATIGGADEVIARMKGEKTLVSEMLRYGLNKPGDIDAARKEVGTLMGEMMKTMRGLKSDGKRFDSAKVDDAIAKATEAFKKAQEDDGGEDKPKYRKRF